MTYLLARALQPDLGRGSLPDCDTFFYADGLRWRFTGAVGTWSLELSTGGIGFLVFELRAQMLDNAMSLMAILGVTAGNRFCVIAPAAKATGMRPGKRDGLGQLDIALQLDGADSPLFLAQF